MTRILTQNLLTTDIKELNMEGNGEVDEELLRKAKQEIEVLLIDLDESDTVDWDSEDEATEDVVRHPF